MSTWFSNRPVRMLLAGLTLGLLVGVGLMIGTLAGIHYQRSVGLPFPETLLHASASHSGESFAMATGPIDEEVEGLFTLDYLTGELQCFVINPRNYQWGGVFKANVVSDLGVQQGKKPNYVMVTGMANFQRGAAANAPAMCAVYVADANTGNFVAYGLSWNRTMARGMAPQAGALVKLGVGKARSLEIRE